MGDDGPRVRIRVDLERGRLRRSAGDKAAALPLFERALEVRLRDPENAAAIEHAREAVAEAKQALGRD